MERDERKGSHHSEHARHRDETFIKPAPRSSHRHYRKPGSETPSEGTINRDGIRRHEKREREEHHHHHFKNPTSSSSKKGFQVSSWDSPFTWKIKSFSATPAGASAATPTLEKRVATPSEHTLYGKPPRKLNFVPEGTPSYAMNSWGGDPSKRDKILGEGFNAEEDRRFDMQFYDAEEGGASTESFGITSLSSWTLERTEEELTKKKEKMSAKKRAIIADNEKWEDHQLLASGAVKQGRVETEFDDEAEVRVQLLVYNTKPPFLDKRFKFTTVLKPVIPVRDPTSDFAVLSTKGSRLVRETRERKEREKMTRYMLDESETQLGKLTGAKRVKEEDEEAEGATADYHEAFETKATAADRAKSKQELALKRRSLPIYEAKRDLMRIIHDNQVTVIIGETGCGKTTQLTQYCLEEGLGKYGMIGCTQPRRVAAVSVAVRVSEEMGVECGDEVGFSIRFEDRTSKKTRIKYMTEGILLRESLKDPTLNAYSVVIMDEAHERSLNTDILFGIMKQVVARRTDMKLIVTSATMDQEKFARFFGDVPTFTIKGRTFRVESFFSKTPVEDYVEAAVSKALQIHMSSPPGDILIFMTGQEDIDVTCTVLRERMKAYESAPPLLVLPIYSQLPSELQAKIFKKSEARKVIVATNIAETSLTVDGIIYVIDPGFCKMKVYNPKIGMDALQVYPISQQNADQRKGRAGRTAPGQCFRLYTENAYLFEMLKSTVPEIQRTNLSNTVLLLKSLGIDDLLKFEFMDPPPQENIRQSLYQLWVLGALDNTGALTDLGRKMVEFPLDPPLSKMLIRGSENRCGSELLTIVSMLSVPSVFIRTKENAEQSDAMREKFFVAESDHLTLLNIFRLWKMERYSASWCARHFIQYKAMKKIAEIRTQLEQIFTDNRMDSGSYGESEDVIRKVISSAYFLNTALVKGLGEYTNLFTSVPCHLHPTSALYGLGYSPDYLCYHELVLTSREFMMCVTAVDPHWLAELGPAFFAVKEDYKTRLENKKRHIDQRKKMKDELKEASLKLAERRQKEDDAFKARLSMSASRIATPGLYSGSITPSWKRTPYLQHLPSVEELNSHKDEKMDKK